jgi:ankyrin repeat protein
VIGNKDGSLIDWFLAQGADPNLGCQKLFQDRFGEPDRNSCDSLEAAARTGSVDLVRKLLDAGAKISNGAPLYCASGVCPPGTSLSLC